MSAAQRNLVQTHASDVTTRSPTQLGQFAVAEELSRAMDTSRRQLEAAMRRNDELLRLRSMLNQKVSTLELALAKAHQFTHYDELTGLPNRRLLLDRFIQASALANRQRNFLALLYFDLNDFKGVNDKLGHEAGDKLLQLVATRLSTSIRQSDTACRYGGDEFVVLLTAIDNREHAVAVRQNIRACLAPLFENSGYSIRLTVSDGLAIYPEDAQRFTDLLRLADRSMFSNKSGSRGRAAGEYKSSIWSHGARKVSCFGQ
ncbi:MAG: GGDEF domain-containing protein [Woeseiaceae bacterium]|nr:GGDEF domain-containing protein [Woeseiaceae bacterium]